MAKVTQHLSFADKCDYRCSILYTILMAQKHAILIVHNHITLTSKHKAFDY